MTAVFGGLGLLLDTPLTPEQREFAELVHRGAAAQLAVITQVLDFSTIEAGKVTVESQPLDLRLVVAEVAALLAVEAEAKGLRLSVRYAPDAPRDVIGDAERIRQVLTNLVGNAVKFTAQGHVLITVTPECQVEGRARLRLTVEDTGIGVPAEKLSEIFDRFTQADGSTTREFGGTGLGLAISRRLAEVMGGTIGVSSHVGEGSTF